MTSKVIMQIAVAFVIDAVTVWELRQLWRRPRDPALRVLVAGLVAVSITLTFGISLPPFEPPHELMASAGIDNVIWTFMAWCYATFFWLVGTHPRSFAVTRRRVATSFALYLALVTAHLVVDHLMPAGSLRTTLFVITCYGYALVMFGLGAGRAAQHLRRLRHRWARAGVLLVTVGGATMSIGVDLTEMVRYILLPVVAPGVRPSWMSDFYNSGRVGGQILLAIGLALVPLATLIVRVRAQQDRRRRAQLEREMRPLWQLVATEFPWLVLPSTTSLKRDLARTTTEVTDGLARLATYIDRTPEDAASCSTADLIVEALQRRDEQRTLVGGASTAVPAEPPHPQLEPDFGADWRTRAQWMVDLSQELERRGAMTAKGAAGDVAPTP